MNKRRFLRGVMVVSIFVIAPSARAEGEGAAAAPAVETPAAAPTAIETPTAAPTTIETPAADAVAQPAPAAPAPVTTSSAAAAAPIQPAAPTSATPAKGGLGVAKAKPAKARHHYLGVLLDIGVPDLVGVSVVGRPLRWMRLALGATTDGFSAGIRGGVTLVPFNFAISPSLTIEGGHVFDGNMNSLSSKFGVTSPALSRVGYDYANGHLGLELGSPNRLLFFIHGGYSYLTAQVHNLQSAVGGSKGGAPMFGDPTITLIGPSAKLGLVVYFL